VADKPNFFIVGAPKCGTTSLADWLGAHPQVFMPSVKEPHHYNTDIGYVTRYRDPEEYARLFEEAGPAHARVGEASVWYLYSQEAVPRLLDDCPEARLIALLRDPADMAVSLHRQLAFNGWETEHDFAEAWKLQDRRRHGDAVPAFCPDRSLLLYRDACSLGSQLERLYRVAGPDRVLPVVLDDIKQDPRQVWLRVLDFLGVDDDGRRDFPVINTAKVRRSTFVRMLRHRYADLRQRLGLPGLGLGLFDYLDKVNVKKPETTQISQQMHETLRQEFSEEVDKLERCLERNLADWKDEPADEVSRSQGRRG
jgi:hypothetical protein